MPHRLTHRNAVTDLGQPLTVTWLSLMTLTAYAQPPSLEGWRTLHAKGNVQVLSRDVTDSDIIAVRGISTLPFPVEEVYAVMSDNHRSSDWMPQITKKEIIRQVDSTSRIEYSLVKMPWPLTNRYTVALGTLSIQPGRVYHIDYKSVAGEYDEPDRIRVRLDRSTFFLKATTENYTYIDLTLLSDPMGYIPKFMVNVFQKNWPVQFLEGLKNEIETIRAEQAKSQDPSTNALLSH
jgi:START domain